MEEYTPITTLLPYNGPERPPLVMGILESMSPVGGSIHYNGCFHCIVKDPTGKIGGTIHHKIMTNPKWQGKIIQGVTLILTSIAIFRPTRKSAYLNITIKNLQHVIELDNE